MKLEFIVNEYLLAWYLLYSTSLSKEIDKFRKNLWNKYKKEYNFCYKDKQEIIKYGRDFIPDNDVLYNEILTSDLYISLKKEVVKHKMYLTRLFTNNENNITKNVKEILKFKLNDTYHIYVIHPQMEVIEYNEQSTSIVFGSDKDKYDVITILILTLVKGIYKNYNNDHKEIVDSVVELAIINEFNKRMVNKDAYDDGDKMLNLIKRQIYPFWLMYLGISSKEELVSKMMEDKIVFDLDKYPIDKNMKKMDLTKFIDFCIKNNKHILKLDNVLKIEKEEDIEVI